MEKYSDEKVFSELKKLDGWDYKEGYLVKEFVFKNFREALSYMVMIAFEADEMDHHPDWSNSYKKLIIKLRTHSADGITENDFKLASKIDHLIAKS